MIGTETRLAKSNQPSTVPTCASHDVAACTDAAIVPHQGSSPTARVHHTYGGKTYKFTHLDPHTETFVRPAGKGLASEAFTVDIRYSDHCFTRGPKTGEKYAAELVYLNGEKKIRLFCPKRNEMSKLLPDLIRSLPERALHHNGNNGNFFTVDALDLDGGPVKYIIIFNVRKSGKGRMELLVETAYTEDPDYGSAPLNGRRVRFWIILNNTSKGIKIQR